MVSISGVISSLAPCHSSALLRCLKYHERCLNADGVGKYYSNAVLMSCVEHAVILFQTFKVLQTFEVGFTTVDAALADHYSAN